MELTEPQKMLVDVLKALNIEKENIIAVALMLKKENQLMEMLWWLHDNWKKGITQSQLMDKALEIMQKYQ